MEPNTEDTPFAWLQRGFESRLDNPMLPIDSFDTRPAISDLLLEYRPELDQMENEISTHPLYKASRHDRFWLLRFLLSKNSKVEAALLAATSTLQFRQEHELDSFDVRNINVNDRLGLQDQIEGSHPYLKQLQVLLDCGEENAYVSYLPDCNRDIITIIRVAGRGLQKVRTKMTEEDYLKAMIIFAEWTFQWLDYTSRKTGRLTKNLRIVDVEGIEKRSIYRDINVYRWEGRNAKLMLDKYPQLLGSIFIVNTPIWIRLAFKVLFPFAPKSVREKVAVIDPNGKQGDLERCFGSCRKGDWPKLYGGDLENWPKIPLIDHQQFHAIPPVRATSLLLSDMQQATSNRMALRDCEEDRDNENHVLVEMAPKANTEESTNEGDIIGDIGDKDSDGLGTLVSMFCVLQVLPICNVCMSAVAVFTATEWTGRTGISLAMISWLAFILVSWRTWSNSNANQQVACVSMQSRRAIILSLVLTFLCPLGAMADLVQIPWLWCFYFVVGIAQGAVSCCVWIHLPRYVAPFVGTKLEESKFTRSVNWAPMVPLAFIFFLISGCLIFGRIVGGKSSFDKSEFPDSSTSPYTQPYPANSVSFAIVTNFSPIMLNMRHGYVFWMPSGTPVLASRGGVVLSVSDDVSDTYWSKDSHDDFFINNFIVIDHGRGIFSKYTCIQEGSAIVAEGDKVEQGEELASSGMGGSGCSVPSIWFRVENEEGDTIPVSFADLGIPRPLHFY